MCRRTFCRERDRLRTLRVSAFSNDFTPLSGSGTLYNLRMLRTGITPGATTALTWRVDPDNFLFIDGDLTIHSAHSSKWPHYHYGDTGNTNADRHSNGDRHRDRYSDATAHCDSYDSYCDSDSDSTRRQQRRQRITMRWDGIE